MKYLISIILLTNVVFAEIENVSLLKVLKQFRNNEFNMLLAPKDIIAPSKYKKTRKAINKGYKRAIYEIIRIVRIKGININLKAFSPKGSHLPQYVNEDKKTYKILKKMLEAEVKFREAIKTKLPPPRQVTNTQQVSADDISLDIGDDALDISNATSNDMQGISPAEIFKTSFIEMSELYNQEVLQLSKALHPFNVNDKPKMKPVHSVFGMAFFPTKNGAIKMMRIYIVLCNINTETKEGVQIIAKETPEFRWDRNDLYINGMTNKIIRQIISGVLGEPIDTNE